MNDFPAIVLSEIFDFLNIPEKHREIKLVCKKWKFVVETMNFQLSACFYSNEYPYKESWRFSHQKKVAEEDMLRLKYDHENSLKFDVRMDYFRNLQRVFLYKIGKKVNLFLEEVNSLAKLKMLIIENQTINSPKLSSFSLEKFFLKCSDLSNIQLNTPNLSSFILWHHNKPSTPRPVEFGFPLKVKHLECFEFNLNLSVLTNLETLICQKIIEFDFKLKNFKCLTRLELFPRNEHDFRVAKRIREERGRLKRVVSLWVSGVKEGPDAPIHSIFSNYSNFLYYLNLEYVLKSYSSLADHAIPWEFNLTIPTLLNHVDSIPADFFEKFPRINTISLASPEEITEKQESSLLQFIIDSNPIYPFSV